MSKGERAPDRPSRSAKLLTTSSAPPYDALLENGLAECNIGGPSVIEERD
jgi:hypothetical protein